MAKLTKAQNPFGVKKGQVWRSDDPRRNRKLTVVKIFLDDDVPFAEVTYPATKTARELVQRVKLERFDRYQKISD